MKTIIKYDWMYLVRTSKLFVIGILGVLLAGLSAVTAKYFHEIMAYAFRQEGIDVEFEEATVFESYNQFFGNFNQFYLFVVLFIAVAFFTHDKTRGHYPLIFSKPIRRSTFLVSKSLLLMGVVLASLMLSAIIFGYYTFYLFDEFAAGLFILSILAYFVYLMLFVHVGLVFSVIMQSYMGSIAMTIIVFFVASLLTILDWNLLAYLPIHLGNYALLVMNGNVPIQTLLITVGVGVVLIAGLIALSISLFNKKALA